MTLRRIAAVIISAAIILTFTGCNSATSARGAVEMFEHAMNENNFRQAFAYVADYDSFNFENGSEEIIKAVAKSLDINIYSENSSGTSVVIDADVTTVDLRELYRSAAKNVIPTYYEQAVSGNSISSEDVSNRLRNEVILEASSESAPVFTTRCSITVNKNSKGKWLIVMDSPLLYAITGYLEEANSLITTGAITQVISGPTTAPTTAPTMPVSPTDAPDAKPEE